ncbi:MAG: PTS system mannose/fructose/sorbose family transporter subunit IID [Longicatena sp.]
MQTVLNGMVPGLLPLLYTLLMLYFMDKKKMSPVTLMLITMVVGVIGCALGILA